MRVTGVLKHLTQLYQLLSLAVVLGWIGLTHALGRVARTGFITDRWAVAIDEALWIPYLSGCRCCSLRQRWKSLRQAAQSCSAGDLVMGWPLGKNTFAMLVSRALRKARVFFVQGLLRDVW